VSHTRLRRGVYADESGCRVRIGGNPRQRCRMRPHQTHMLGAAAPPRTKPQCNRTHSRPVRLNSPALCNFSASDRCLCPTLSFFFEFIRNGINSRYAITLSSSSAQLHAFPRLRQTQPSMSPEPTEQINQTDRQAEQAHNETHTDQNILTSFHDCRVITWS